MIADNLQKLWQCYEAGRDYNSRLTPSQYRVVETNREFFNGNQWPNLPDMPGMSKLHKPVFNILKRIVRTFVASLSSSNLTIHTEPLSAEPDGGAEEPSCYANPVLDTLLEKLNFQYWFRQALYDGAITGDFAFHFWFDPDARGFYPSLQGTGEIQMELLPGIDVMFGNPNDRKVENQPYILIIGRDSVQALREEARRNRRRDGDPDSIRSDHETADFPGVGGQTELSETEDGAGKALYILCYEKKRGADGAETVHVTKAAKDGFIYRDVDTGLTFYPLAWGNWERQDHQYHGRALLTEYIPAQIFINTMHATIQRHFQLCGFPKTIYNADLISAWDNEVGQAIGVRGLQPGQSIDTIARQFQPGNLSGQMSEYLDKTLALIKECAGATDAQMGNARPDNTSALMFLQTTSEVPLENVRAELRETAEQIGRILLDMVGTYWGIRIVQTEQEVLDLYSAPDGAAALDPMTGMIAPGKTKIRVAAPYDFAAFKNLWFTLRIDVGGAPDFSETSMAQSLDAMRNAGILTDEEYLDRIPDRLIPQKRELLDARRGGVPASRPAQIGGGPMTGAPLSAERAAQGVPDNMGNVLNQVQSQLQNKALSIGASRMK